MTLRRNVMVTHLQRQFRFISSQKFSKCLRKILFEIMKVIFELNLFLIYGIRSKLYLKYFVLKYFCLSWQQIVVSFKIFIPNSQLYFQHNYFSMDSQSAHSPCCFNSRIHIINVHRLFTIELNGL